MTHHTWLQHIRLATMLLVIGRLLAPLPSEAEVPTLTLKVDGGTTTSIVLTTPVPCTSAETSSGFTQCYAIDTSKTVAGSGAPVNRSYNIRNAPNTTARLRVADKTGRDLISIAGVHFIPAVTNWGSAQANANEQHVLTITMVVTLDSPINVNNAGSYAYNMRASGEFRAGPNPGIPINMTACTSFTTTGACNTVGNVIDLPGKGTFSPTLVNVDILNPAGSATNTVPLRLEVTGPTSGIVSFDLSQLYPYYPTFYCDVDGGGPQNVCKPTITHTMTVRLKGPDSFLLQNGGDIFAANCAVGPSAAQEKQLDRLEKLVNYLNLLEKARPNDKHLSAVIDKLKAVPATIRNQDPHCPGAAMVDLDIAIEAAQDQIAFIANDAVPAEPADTINGPSPSTQTSSMGNSNSKGIIIPVAPGTHNIIETPQTWRTVSSASCGPEKPTVGIVVVKADNNATCTFFHSVPATH